MRYNRTSKQGIFSLLGQNNLLDLFGCVEPPFVHSSKVVCFYYFAFPKGPPALGNFPYFWTLLIHHDLKKLNLDATRIE
jgi:hypothetical protein